METSPYIVNELSTMRLPWLVRFRLRWIRRRPQTGLLLYGIFNSSARTISKYTPIIDVREGRRTLCFCAAGSKFPKWVALDPGLHDLRFVAFRPRTKSSFDKKIILLPGDILVAICKPIDAKLILTKRRSADVWHLGTVSSVSSS